MADTGESAPGAPKDATPSPEAETGDLSSLIEAPVPASAEEPSPQPVEVAEAGQPTPVQFESLEEFSHETATPQAHEEQAPSGLDMSLVDIAEQAESASVSVSDAGAGPGTEPGIDSIRKFSDNMATSDPQVGAAFPFTLKIEGKLAPEDAEKLLSILTRENMGFREVDLEPQLAEGKILIPRISEYAGVLLIQALRAIPARISFGPSDDIFSTPETREDPASCGAFATDWTARDEAGASAVELPVTNADTLPQFSRATAIDTVVASGLLTTRAIEAASSEEYEILLEALIREIRFKAHRRGANGILALRVQLTPLTLPTDYRVTVTATAVFGTSGTGSD